MNAIRGLLVVGALLAVAVAAPAARAQATGKDDALDKLLEKLEDTKPKDGKAPQEPKPGEVKAGDKELDSLLKKLGESNDKPDTKSEPAGPGGAGPMPPEPKAPGDAKKDDLPERDKDLDEHLRELTGLKRKKSQGQQKGKGQGQGQGQGQDDGPLTEAIKKMEQVRQKLGEKDTGETTRKTEGEVVQELDQLLEAIRKARSQSQSKKQRMDIAQAGQKGNPQDQQEAPNPDGKGVGAQQPKKPKLNDMLAGQKDTWGDLPPSLREEMENVFKEDMLPAKRDMIIRYYTSVSKKGRTAAGEGQR